MTRLLLSAPLCPYIQLSSRFTCGPEIWIVPCVFFRLSEPQNAVGRPVMSDEFFDHTT